jgi:hypothetical protein
MAGEKICTENNETKAYSGDYVLCFINSIEGIDLNAIVMLFKEEKATTIILKSWLFLNLEYTSVMAWITQVHSSLRLWV